MEGLEEMREEELIRNILLVVFLTRRSWALFPPATETLETERRAALCYHEDGRMTFEGWVVVTAK